MKTAKSRLISLNKKSGRNWLIDLKKIQIYIRSDEEILYKVLQI